MDELRELYQEMILDHHKRPRNRHKMEKTNHKADGYNPLCGDRVTVYLLIDGDTITDISFEGSGCAICTASTSLMTDILKGKTMTEAATVFGRFHELVTSDPTTEVDASNLGKLAIFSGVREYPVRIKCATLPWHTFQAAAKDSGATATTE